MKRIALALLAVVPVAAFAVSPPSVKDTCSTKAPETKKKSALIAAAKIQPGEAQTIAIDASKGTKVAKGGIFDRDGCLVYVFEIRNEAEKTQSEVIVDSGNGKVLWQNKTAAPAAPIAKPTDNVKAMDALSREKMAADKAKGVTPPVPSVPPKK